MKTTGNRAFLQLPVNYLRKDSSSLFQYRTGVKNGTAILRVFSPFAHFVLFSENVEWRSAFLSIVIVTPYAVRE